MRENIANFFSTSSFLTLDRAPIYIGRFSSTKSPPFVCRVGFLDVFAFFGPFSPNVAQQIPLFSSVLVSCERIYFPLRDDILAPELSFFLFFFSSCLFLQKKFKFKSYMLIFFALLLQIHIFIPLFGKAKKK